VTDAVQTLREQARNTGHLNSSEQETVTTQGNTIVIQPGQTRMWSTCLLMILGSSTERLSSLIRGWYPVPGFFGAASDSLSALGFGIGSSEDLGGAGVTGDLTGVAIA